MREQLWYWRGLDPNGIEHRGTLWASHRPAALMALAQQNIIALSLKRRTINQSLWRAQHSCAVISQLATLLQAGLTLSDSLALLSQQHPTPQWRALLNSLASRLAQGVTLSEGLKSWPQAFPPLYLAMIRTGEITGKLEQCCLALSQQQKTQLLLTAKVKKGFCRISNVESAKVVLSVV